MGRGEKRKGKEKKEKIIGNGGVQQTISFLYREELKRWLRKFEELDRKRLKYM